MDLSYDSVPKEMIWTGSNRARMKVDMKPKQAELIHRTFYSDIGCSLSSIHFLNWLSRMRHWPPILQAGTSFCWIILRRVRFETCSISAASSRVKNLSSVFDIAETSCRLSKGNASNRRACKSLLFKSQERKRPETVGLSNDKK